MHQPEGVRKHIVDRLKNKFDSFILLLCDPPKLLFEVVT